MKITHSTEKINSFGGINFTDQRIKQNSLHDIVEQLFGSRGSKFTYFYSNLIRSYFLLILNGSNFEIIPLTENKLLKF